MCVFAHITLRKHANLTVSKQRKAFYPSLSLEVIFVSNPPPKTKLVIQPTRSLFKIVNSFALSVYVGFEAVHFCIQITFFQFLEMEMDSPTK